jgi:hypothetical protein
MDASMAIGAEGGNQFRGVGSFVGAPDYVVKFEMMVCPSGFRTAPVIRNLRILRWPTEVDKFARLHFFRKQAAFSRLRASPLPRYSKRECATQLSDSFQSL